MLVLSRHQDQEIYIGDDIVVTIVGMDRGRVQVGVTAPKSVPIMRAEIADRHRDHDPRHPNYVGR